LVRPAISRYIVVLLVFQHPYPYPYPFNSRPRKCLGYKTPYEVFEELTGIKKNTLTGFALIT